jgi:hypothetical protein
VVRRYTKDEVDQILHSRVPDFTPDNGVVAGLPGAVPAPQPGDALVDKVLSASGVWITPGAAASGNLNAYTLKTETAAISAGLQLSKSAVTTLQAISAGLNTRINSKISTGLGLAGNWNNIIVNADGIVTSGAFINYTGSSSGSGSGATTFKSLTDVPSSYAGYSGRSLRVTESQNGLEYYSPQNAYNVKDFGAYGDDTSRILNTSGAAVFNARYGSYGLVAVSGDETDWAAIQGTLLKAAYTAIPVYLPTGTYRVNKPLTLSWTSTPGPSATGYPLVSRMFGDGLQSIIRSYNITSGRASLEFLGESNPVSVNMECSNFTIYQHPSCAYDSYCMRVGDAWCGFKGFRLNLQGAQALALKMASSVSYANLCTNFEQCRFWSNYGYQWFANDDLATTFCVNNETGGAFWDNVKFTSCMFNGLVQPRAFILDFDNCQFYVNPKRPLAFGYDFAINCYLYLGSATFRNCYFEDHKVAISAASFTADVRKIHAIDCHFSGVTNFASGAPFVESAIRVFPSVNGVIGTVMIEGCSFGDDLYTKGSIDVEGCTLIERGSYNITKPGKPITRNVSFTLGEWDDQDYNLSDGLTSNRTSTYKVDRFKKIDVNSTNVKSIHTSGGILADITVNSPQIIACRPLDAFGNQSGNIPGSIWGVGPTKADAGDNLYLSWSGTAYTTGGVVPWVENDNAHLYVPGGKRLRVGFGVDPNNYIDLKNTGIEVRTGTLTAPYHQINRNATGTENGSLWYTAVEDASGTNQLVIGNTSTTYSTGGFLTWIGNNQPFINTSFTKGLKIGFATFPIPYNFQYNRLDTPGDVYVAGQVVSTGEQIYGNLSVIGNTTLTGNVSLSGTFTSQTSANSFNQILVNNLHPGNSSAAQVRVSCDRSSINLGSFSRGYPVPDQSWVYTDTNTPMILGTGGTARMVVTSGGSIMINNHFSQDNGVDKLQVVGSGRFTGKIVADNIKTGSGTPEGALSGNVGDIYQRNDGGIGTTLYVKSNGSGTTGWQALTVGSTGSGGTGTVGGTGSPYGVAYWIDTNTIVNNPVIKISESPNNGLTFYPEADGGYSPLTTFYSNSTQFYYYPYINLGRSRGTTLSKTAVNGGDYLGGLFFSGYDGAGGWYNNSAILAVASANASAGYVPQKMLFNTGSAGGVTRLEIAHNGEIHTTADTPAVWLHSATDFQLNKLNNNRIIKTDGASYLTTPATLITDQNLEITGTIKAGTTIVDGLDVNNGVLKNHISQLLEDSGSTVSIPSTAWSGNVINLTGSTVTLTVPNDLPIGFTCLVIQGNSGTITVTAGSGATVLNRQGHTTFAGQYATASFVCIANPGGSSAQVIFTGDTAP